MKKLVSSSALVLAAALGSWFISANTHVQAANTTPAGLITAGPDRVLNTRNTGKLAAGGEVVVSTGVTGAVAVAVNITITDAEGDGGYVTAWAGGGRPDASIINANNGQTLANAAIVPVNADGTFRLFTFKPAHLLVDLMGYFPGTGTVSQSSGLTASITGYAPGFSITTVTGTATNGTGATKTFRVEVKCPNGSVQTDSFFSMASGTTKGWTVICDGAFSSGASIQNVIEI